MSSQPAESRASDRGRSKYSRGTGARPASSAPPLKTLEWITLVHVSGFVVATTWAFGGNAEWVRVPLSVWGSLGLLITVAQLRDRADWRDGWMRPLRWLWPVVAFNSLVLLACLNPSLREMKHGTESLLINSGARPGWPSSARPALALELLWWFDVAWISAFNIALVVRQRRAIRALLLLAVINALVLSVFGTAQKLTNSKGIFFGAVSTTQPHFFSSFVYHNHWGAFTVLMLCVSLGLTWHYARRGEARNFFHSPAFGGLVAIFFMAATVPLSTSRSCTLLAMLLLGGAFLHWLASLLEKRRRFHEPVRWQLAGAFAALALTATGVWFVARESITARVAKTREQIADMRARGGVGARADLYRNTWRMAQAKPWFGWGMGSYPHVFTFYNTQDSPLDRLPIFYRDAHSDWLQAFAEHGRVGSLLLGLCAVVPLSHLRRRQLGHVIPGYLLTGCALILLYAWVEFPFGNFAVVVAWWFCFFCALQYARLQDRERSPAPPPPAEPHPA